MNNGKQTDIKLQKKACQKLWRNVITFTFVVQAILIGIKGNLDVLSGKPVIDVIQGMIAQSIELIIKAHRAEKRLKKSDCLRHQGSDRKSLPQQ